MIKLTLGIGRYWASIVAHGLEQDKSNLPYVDNTRKYNTCIQPSKNNGATWYLNWNLATIILWGTWATNVQVVSLASYLASTHPLVCQASKSPEAIRGLQVSFGTHTIWGPFILVMISLGTQIEWFQLLFFFPTLWATTLPLVFLLIT